MHVLRHAREVSAFIKLHPQSEIATLIQRRLTELLPEEDAPIEELVFFVVLESGDTLADLEAVIASPVRTPDGQPLWEVIEAHITCYEMVFVLSSSGYGALVFVPYLDAHPELLTLCRSHAMESSSP